MKAVTPFSRRLWARQALESSSGFAHQPLRPGMLRSRTSGRRKQFLAGKSVHMHRIFSSKICDVFEDVKQFGSN